MGRRDPRIDAYIAKSADFATPILEAIRAQVHATCPACEETIKWGMPTFTYKGILCAMAAFKAHASLIVWHGGQIADAVSNDRTIGQFGRLTRVADLPGKRELAGYLRKAMAIKDAAAAEKAKPRPAGDRARVASAAATRAPKRLAVPPFVRAALRTNAKARATFDAFPPSHKREYVEWITEAKQDATRERRLAQAIAWMAEGKPRNWKYMRRM